MKTFHRHLLTAGLLAAFGLGAIAQTQTPPAPSAGGAQTMQGQRGMHGQDRMEHRRARMQERMAKRLGHLKAQLRITPAQEAAWTAWTAALQPAGQRMQRPDRAEFARLTTPERIDRMRAMRAARNARMDQRLDATKTFYGTLSSEQKAVFDAVGLKMVRGGKGMRGGHGRHGRHHG